MINERIGLRASYYLGLTDVPSDYFYNTNYKNNTFSFSVLVNASASLANLKAQISTQKVFLSYLTQWPSFSYDHETFFNVYPFSLQQLLFYLSYSLVRPDYL